MIKKILFLGGVLMVCAVSAAPTQQDLRAIEKQLAQERETQKDTQRRANVLSGEVKSVQHQMVRLAKTVQSQESKLSVLEKKQAELLAEEARLTGRLSLSNHQLAQVMKGMQTLALRPSELLIFQKKTPVQMLRSREMMRYSLPVIGSVKRQTQEDLSQLSLVRSDLQKQIAQIKTTTAQLSEQNQQMDRLAQQKSLLQAQYATFYARSKQRADDLAAQAKDIKDLLERLAQEKKRAATQPRRAQPSAPPIPTGAFSRSYGALPLPARGSLKQSFGEVGVSGAHSKGIVLSTRSAAQIITPFDGTVLFAGPFKNYGELLIVDHGDNYLTLLAGLDKINASVGQELLAGEPIGIMKSSTPDLYIEIRKDGVAIDPRPWFAQKI